VTVTNNGPSVAREVQLVNRLPDGLTDLVAPDTVGPAALARVVGAQALVQILQADRCLLDGLVATCQLEDLAPGSSTNLVFSGVVPSTAADASVFIDTASITSATDTVTANNAASAAVTVVRAPVPPTPPPTPTPTPTPPAPTPTPPAPGPTPEPTPAAPQPSEPGAVQGGGLPRTGAAVGGLLLLGLGLTLGGITLRRRVHRSRTGRS
jgi:hypothetical protein